MKGMVLIGVILVVLGVIALVYQGVSYTTREKVFQVGPIEATQKTEKTIPLPPVIGVAALVGGVVLIVLGARRSRL